MFVVFSLFPKMCPGPHLNKGRVWRRENDLSPPVKYFTDRSLWIFMFFLSCVCYAFVRVCLSVPCGHLLGRADLLALVCVI